MTQHRSPQRSIRKPFSLPSTRRGRKRLCSASLRGSVSPAATRQLTCAICKCSLRQTQVVPAIVLRFCAGVRQPRSHPAADLHHAGDIGCFIVAKGANTCALQACPGRPAPPPCGTVSWVAQR